MSYPVIKDSSFKDLKNYFAACQLSEKAVFAPGFWATFAWEVVLAPCRVLCALFLECLAPFLHLLNQSEIALDCEVFAKRCINDLTHLIGLICYGKDFIAPLPSFYTYDARSVYQREPFTKEDIDWDMPVLFKFDNSLPTECQTIEYYLPQGICRGVTSLFISLYVKSARENPEEHLCLIAACLSQESVRVALLAVFHLSEELLNLQKLQDPLPPSIQMQKPAILDAVARLAPGMYTVELIGHKMAYLKVDDTTGFLINHLNAVLRVSPETLADCILSYRSTHLFFFAMHERVDEAAS